MGDRFDQVLDKLLKDHAGLWAALACCVPKERPDMLKNCMVVEELKRGLVIYDDKPEARSKFGPRLVSLMKWYARMRLDSPLRYLFLPESAGVEEGVKILNVLVVRSRLENTKQYVASGGVFPDGASEIVIGLTWDGQAFLGTF